MTQRIPPQALEIEQAVLGAVMLQRDALVRVADLLTPEMFYSPKHRTIYGACLQLSQEGSPIDILTVTQKLRKNGQTEASGGPFYLTELTSRVSSAANIEFHARSLAEKWILRGLIELTQKVADKAYSEETDCFDLLTDVDSELVRLGRVTDSGKAVKHRDALRLMLKNLEDVAAGRAAPAISFGFKEIDYLMNGGGRAGDLIIIGARPGMGKSNLAVNISMNVARQGYPVYFVSLEMSTQQQVERTAALTSTTSMGRIKAPKRLQSSDWARLTMAANETQSFNITWDSPGMLTAVQLRAKAMRWARAEKVQEGKGLLVLDYLQLVQPEGRGGGNREQDVSHVSRTLKQLGMEIGIPVIALSQLSRDVEKRTNDKRPVLSDLRESGAIEQDADYVQFIYRDEYYNPNGDVLNYDPKAEYIQAKGRGAAIGTGYLHFHGEFSRFIDDPDSPNKDLIRSAQQAEHLIELPPAPKPPPF